MEHEPLLKSLMTPFPWSIALEATADEAQALMAEHNVRHLPVTDGGELVGILTDRDLKAVLARRTDNGDGLNVRDVFLSEAFVVDIDTRLADTLLEMAERHIGSVLITRKGRLAGVLTGSDACRAFGEYLNKRFPHEPGTDAA
ncbi:MAG: CBS domain-containing protein [Gammaproteobacteria bacterium]|nr:CBS domain-containing protein [Gammaproteobacteria bacterium]NNM00827.1 CBS domain-containing protein [Gammaproteobacteria bacterium]